MPWTRDSETRTDTLYAHLPSLPVGRRLDFTPTSTSLSSSTQSNRAPGSYMSFTRVTFQNLGHRVLPSALIILVIKFDEIVIVIEDARLLC